MQRHLGNTRKGLIIQFKPNQVRKITICFVLPVCFAYGCSKQFELKYNHGENVSASKLNEPVSFQPNIILILADDVGYEIPAYTGGQSYSTPNLDKMMQNGMRFTNCNASPLCSPSRFMLLTGKYNFRNYTQWGNMDRSQKTFGNMLKDVGYSTYYAGKLQLNGGDTSIR